MKACGCQGWKPQKGDKLRYRVRWRDPAGKECAQVFRRAIDAEQHRVSIEDSKLRGAYVDPQQGRTRLKVRAERWFDTTATPPRSGTTDYCWTGRCCPGSATGG